MTLFKKKKLPELLTVAIWLIIIALVFNLFFVFLLRNSGFVWEEQKISIFPDVVPVGQSIKIDTDDSFIKVKIESKGDFSLINEDGDILLATEIFPAGDNISIYLLEEEISGIWKTNGVFEEKAFVYLEDNKNVNYYYYYYGGRVLDFFFIIVLIIVFIGMIIISYFYDNKRKEETEEKRKSDMYLKT